MKFLLSLILLTLLGCGAHDNAQESYAMAEAAKRDDAQAVKDAYDNGGTPTFLVNGERTVLMVAVEYGALESVKLMMGMFPSTVIAIRNKELVIERVNIPLLNQVAPDGETAISLAAKVGHLEIAKVLLEHGADANIDKGLALVHAVKNNNIEMIDLLIENNAEVNTLYNKNGYKHRKKKWTTLRGPVLVDAYANSDHLAYEHLLINHNVELETNLVDDKNAIDIMIENNDQELLDRVLERKEMKKQVRGKLKRQSCSKIRKSYMRKTQERKRLRKSINCIL